MKYTSLQFLLALLLIFSAGCLSQKSITPAELDRYWQLSPLPAAADAAPKRLAGKYPSHWIIRQNPSRIDSAVSINSAADILRAADHLETPADSIEFSISPEYARSIRQTLSDVRLTLENLSELAVSESADRKKWSQTLAGALVTLESSLRFATMEGQPQKTSAASDPAAFAAQPLLEMLSLYLNERAGESLLADLKPEELHQLRTVLVHLTLRIGFDLANRSLPDQLRSEILAQLQKTDDPQNQKPQLETLLTSAVEQAPLAAADNQLRSLLLNLLRWSPKALRVFESFLDQWDRVNYLECRIDSLDNESLITADIHILPRREIRMAQVIPFQPNLVFRGDSRIIIPPENPLTQETAVLFEPSQTGAIELRFENPVYGLVRWLILPLDDAKLREVRVLSASATPSSQMTQVTLLLEALRDKKDPRRAILFQDTKKESASRDLFSVHTSPLHSQKQFHYLRPDKRFSYKHK